jgi:hypothetical protein
MREKHVNVSIKMSSFMVWPQMIIGLITWKVSQKELQENQVKPNAHPITLVTPQWNMKKAVSARDGFNQVKAS